MKRQFFFVIFMLGFLFIGKAQTIVIEHLVTGKRFLLKKGEIIWVQTYEDPVGKYNVCKFDHFDGTNFFLKNPFNLKEEAKVPINQLASIFIKSEGSIRFKRTMLIGIGGGLIIAGALMLTSDPSGLVFLLPGSSLYFAGRRLQANQKIFVPSYEFYLLEK